MELFRSSEKEVLKRNIYRKDDWGLEYLTYPGLTELGCIRHLFSTRLGGVSTKHLASMNLSYSRGDKPEHVTENFRRIVGVLGADISQIVCTDQTHTKNVRVVTREDAGKGVVRERDYSDVDGIITNEKGLVLAAFFADCVPLFFVDPKKEVIGLAHSGWRGTAAAIGEETVRMMQAEFGSSPKDIHAAIGPSICHKCYEVSRDVYDAMTQTFDGDAMLLREVFYQKDDRQKREEKYQMDLWKANELILLRAGILPEHLEVTDLCTAHNPDYLFSHRKTNGKRGNLGAFLMLV